MWKLWVQSSRRRKGLETRRRKIGRELAKLAVRGRTKGVDTGVRSQSFLRARNLLDEVLHSLFEKRYGRGEKRTKIVKGRAVRGGNTVIKEWGNSARRAAVDITYKVMKKGKKKDICLQISEEWTINYPQKDRKKALMSLTRGRGATRLQEKSQWPKMVHWFPREPPWLEPPEPPDPKKRGKKMKGKQ